MFDPDYTTYACAFCGEKIRNILGQDGVIFECGGDIYRAHQDCFEESMTEDENSLCEDCMDGAGYISVYRDPISGQTWGLGELCAESLPADVFKRSRFEHYVACKRCKQPELEGNLYGI